MATPGANDEATTIADCEDQLEGTRIFDRPDLAFTVKELARRMAKPTKGDWMKLKRLGRSLVNKPRVQQVYQWQSIRPTLETYTDAVWAGCRETRKSAIGGCATLGAQSEGLEQDPGADSHEFWRTRTLCSPEGIRGNIRFGGIIERFGVQCVGGSLGRRRRGTRNNQPQGLG